MSMRATVRACVLAAAALWTGETIAQQPFTLEEASIESIHNAIKSGQTTCSEVVQGYVARCAGL